MSCYFSYFCNFENHQNHKCSEYTRYSKYTPILRVYSEYRVIFVPRVLRVLEYWWPKYSEYLEYEQYWRPKSSKYREYEQYLYSSTSSIPGVETSKLLRVLRVSRYPSILGLTSNFRTPSTPSIRTHWWPRYSEYLYLSRIGNQDWHWVYWWSWVERTI